jgi:hypothetical protein
MEVGDEHGGLTIPVGSLASYAFWPSSWERRAVECGLGGIGTPSGRAIRYSLLGRTGVSVSQLGSLRRLQTDWIDLYQVGVPDPNTDIDETLGAP